MEKILITGGTGLVGRKLTELLIAKNYEVVILSRNPQNKNEFKWDVSNNYIDENAFKNLTYIIHLAGAGIADKRWSNDRKKVIISSRVQTTNLLLEKVKQYKIKLKGFISASATGLYGAITSDKIFTEKDKPSHDFLSIVCEKWENAAFEFQQENIPVTILRTGIVLSKKGGALEKMRTPIVSPLGSGKQYIPWIHIDDLCEMYIYAIENNLEGIYNAVAPEHHTSKSFSKELANAIKRPFISLGVPSFLLKILFGEMAVILLEGSRVSIKKIEKKGFSFRFSNLIIALKTFS
ncbi:MAG: TIGR01777 family oxidoreductase [Polaribacter sp.]|uniref:TIGR01777 family oxidoreductase n=1 Tax=Polaribacter sp. TaxID=1920175 RepID=UPI002F35C93A